MKKILAFLLAVFLLQALTGCFSVGNPDKTQQPTSPSNNPTQSSESTVATSPTQETQPPFSKIYVFTYREKQPLNSVRFDLSQCQRDHLYYCHEESKQVVPICDEPVMCFDHNSTGLYFAKKSEPNNLYHAPLTNLAEQTIIYTSEFGPICNLYAHYSGDAKNVVTLTEGNKRGVLFDPDTGDTEVFIQQFYMEDAIIGILTKKDGKWTYDKIWFRGKLNEEDTLKDYFYWVDSGSITEDFN